MYEILIAGVGGQGVMLAGNILAWAAMKEGNEVTFFPSYGAEMRGGTAKCFVVISKDKIGSPVIVNPNIEIIFNQMSFDKYAPKLVSHGLLIYNESLVNISNNIKAESVSIPASKIADSLGDKRVMNIICLAALSKKTNIISYDILNKAVNLAFNGEIKERNLKALEAGYDI